MSLQTAYPYNNNYSHHPTSNPNSSVLPGITGQHTIPGIMSSSQPSTPRPDMMSPPASEKIPVTPDLIRRRPPLPSRPASFTTTTFHSNPYPANTTLRRRRTESSMFSFETGPSFSSTKQNYELINMEQSNGYQVQIHAKMDRGFFRADQDWTCYRRNYFQVSATFDVHGMSYLLQGSEVPCILRIENQEMHQVDFFSIGISARVTGSDKKIELVQHTPKRDKGPQMVPEPRMVSAGGNLYLASVGSNHNIVTFERMQFKTATANNGKRRAAQQYYEIVVDLYANTSTGKLFKVASCTSSPLVVRGRSPGHYADSHTRYRSMDAGTPSAFNGLSHNPIPPNNSSPAPNGNGNFGERYLPPHQQSLPRFGGVVNPSPTTGEFSSPYSSYQPQGYPYQVGYNPVMSGSPVGGPINGRPNEEGSNREEYMMHPYSSHPLATSQPTNSSSSDAHYYEGNGNSNHEDQQHPQQHPHQQQQIESNGHPYWSGNNREQLPQLQSDVGNRYGNGPQSGTNNINQSYVNSEYGYIRSQNDSMDTTPSDPRRSMSTDNKPYIQHHSSANMR
ncbi:hypothetical protein BDB01DRAFT_721816 [Pilobolus umbonatus]|nr:hypothetical protein BDB01DRAFT_721816 [Pilobolus umbonatus]